MPPEPHAFIASLAAALTDARRDLADAIREACPAGHSHAYVQHRDRLPAWCEACGYAEDGMRIREVAPWATSYVGPKGEHADCTWGSACKVFPGLRHEFAPGRHAGEKTGEGA